MFIEINCKEEKIFNKRLEVLNIDEQDGATYYNLRHTKDNILHYSDLNGEYKAKPYRLEVWKNGHFRLLVHFPAKKSWSPYGFDFGIDNYKIIE